MTPEEIAEARLKLRALTIDKGIIIDRWEEAITELLAAGVSSRALAQDAGVSHVTVYRIAKTRTEGTR